MKKTFYIIILISVSRHVLGQTNLVNNPSFETYTACPSSTVGGLVDLASGWYSCGISPDYFNICASPSFSLRGIPSNEVGYQNPKDGNAYGGLVTYNSGNVREYMGTQLNQTLSIGTKYYVSAYISRADTFPYTVSSNKFGFRFSTVAFTYSSNLTDNFSHIHSTSIITDSLGWTKISGSFVADSAYQYFIMGNFYDDSNTNVTNPAWAAYYYIDKTCVSTDSMLCNVSTGFREYDITSDFSIYPNPSSSFVLISNPSGKQFKVSMKSILGTELYENTATTDLQIDLSSFINGVYFIYIRQDNNISVKKIIVRH